MKKEQFLRWASRDGNLLTADGWRFLQIHRLESAFSKAYCPPAPWPGVLGRNFAKLFRWPDVSVTFTLHQERPQEVYKPWGEDHGSVQVSMKLGPDGKGEQTITRGGETYVVKEGEEDPYGTVYTGPLYSYYDLFWNVLLLERFINEGIIADRNWKDTSDPVGELPRELLGDSEGKP